MHSPEIEKRPDPEQMFTLASIGICIAKDQGKLKESARTDNAHIFLSEDNLVVEVKNEEEYLQSRHKFIGRIGRIGYKHWSMRIAEPYWVSAEDGDDGYRTTYAFEWTDRQVLMANRKMRAKKPTEEYGPSYQPPSLDFDELRPDFIHATLQFETLSHADCSRLISDMRQFGQSPKYALEYNR